MKKTVLISFCRVLSACGDIASRVSKAFSFDLKDGQLNGTYNPEGWDADEVQKFIRTDCPSKKLSTYNETPQANGLTAFVAVCA